MWAWLHRNPWEKGHVPIDPTLIEALIRNADGPFGPSKRVYEPPPPPPSPVEQEEVDPPPLEELEMPCDHVFHQIDTYECFVDNSQGCPV